MGSDRSRRRGVNPNTTGPVALSEARSDARLTERLRLVPIAARHAPEIWEIHHDEGVARWCPLSREQALRFAERMEASWRDHGVGKWLAYERSTGSLVGRGGPSWAVVGGAGCVEIGWALRQEAWGRGYATEIGRAGLDHAFSVPGVEEVVAFTEVHNARSRAVMERLGMRQIGRILRPGFVAGSSEMRKDAPFALYRVGRPGRGTR